MVTWGRLTDLVKKEKGLDITPALFFVFSQEDIQLFAIELNTGGPNISEHGQLFLQGIDAEGVDLHNIGGDYSAFTRDLKAFDGLPFDHITLYQEGDFYKSWEFVQKEDSFVLRADTIKEGEDLRDRWGPDIIGLTDESISKLSTEIIPEIINHILRSLLS